MLANFKKHIDASFPKLAQRKVLVAVSGGVDSVVLARLLHMANIQIGIAHCNFHLRGEASKQDQFFVEKLAKELDCPFYTIDFKTEKEAKLAGESIQLTARKLRYAWFYGVAEQHHYHCIATAHHVNDSLENYVMHSIRGTGLKGLLGVPQQTQKVIRPLLPFSKKDIQQEAEHQHWKWREDASNEKDMYFRNRIRHQVVPLLEQENPNLLDSFRQSLHHLQQANDLLEDYSALLFDQLLTPKGNHYSLAIKKLMATPHPKAVLYQLLHPFGFTDWESVYRLIDAETGKQVCSNTHVLEKNRDQLLIFVKKTTAKYPEIEVKITDKVVKLATSILQFEAVEQIEETAKHIAYLDADKLSFPLLLRLANNEDVFIPLGMKGKKKVNHFLRDEKIPTSIKKQTLVLCSNEAVVWVVNHRINEKFKVTENTNRCLKISCLKT